MADAFGLIHRHPRVKIFCLSVKIIALQTVESLIWCEGGNRSEVGGRTGLGRGRTVEAEVENGR